MTTLLEYTIAKYLGPPIDIRGEGESYWDCPHCGSTKFHTMPTKPEFRDRFKCWSCGFRGDLLDWLHEQHPEEPYGDRLERARQLTAEWQALEPVVYSPRGSGSYVAPHVEQPSAFALNDAAEDIFNPVVEGAGEELLETYRESVKNPPVNGLRHTLKMIELGLTMCVSRGIHPEVLAAHVYFLEWSEKMRQYYEHEDELEARRAKGRRAG